MVGAVCHMHRVKKASHDKFNGKKTWRRRHYFRLHNRRSVMALVRRRYPRERSNGHPGQTVFHPYSTADPAWCYSAVFFHLRFLLCWPFFPSKMPADSANLQTQRNYSADIARHTEAQLQLALSSEQASTPARHPMVSTGSAGEFHTGHLMRWLVLIEFPTAVIDRIMAKIESKEPKDAQSEQAH